MARLARRALRRHNCYGQTTVFSSTDRGDGRSGRWASSGRVGKWQAVALLALVAAVAFGFSATPAQSDGVVRGSAQANADTFTLSIKAASATIGLSYGRSLARYQDRTGSAEARALDLGALPTLFGGPQCDGSAPLLAPSALPPITSADSNLVGSDQSRRTQVNLPGISGASNGGPVGFQDATATPLPSSSARTESVPVDVFLVALIGGRTETTAALRNGVREARAVVTADELRVLGGLFTFRKPRWEAVARSGAEQSTTSTFTFQSASILGIERAAGEALADLRGFKVELERALAPLGVTLTLPTTEMIEGGIRVTPMGFRVKEPPLGTDVLVPFLGRIDPLVQALRQELVAQDCKNDVVLTVVDILLGVLGGSGSIEILAGGVEAVTDDTDFSSPPPPLELNDASVEVAPETTIATDFGPIDPGAGSSDTGSFETPPAVDLSVGDLGLGDPAAGASEVAAAVQQERSEEAGSLPSVIGSRFEEGTAGRAGVAVGTLALLGAVGLSIGDRLLGRRARRTIR